ncbi:MAG: translation initiation factor IF-2, partial [Rhodospirillaceae bacterium]|nr:translation initiation factor IF-2 [Rhodospirillaceae bacterium]
MTDGKDIKEEKKPETLSRPGRLELKKTVETGQVRQSFSHGRSRSVTVEVKRKRTYAAGEGGHMAEVKVAPRQSDAAKAAESLLENVSANQNLTSEEKAARTRALETAKQREAEPTVEDVFGKRPEPTPSPADETVADEESAASDVKAATEATAEAATETPKAVTEVEEIVVDPAVPDPSPEIAKTPETRHKKRHEEKEEKAPVKKGKEARHKQTASLHKPSDQRRRASGKLTMSQALDDSGDRTRSLAAMRRAREREREKQRAKETGGDSSKKIVRDVVVPETITITDLANRMAERGADVVKTLMQMGVMATINDTIDADTAELVISEFGHKIRRVSEADVEIGLKTDEVDASKLLPRAPVVTVMGHVDHGKTS